MDRATLVAWHPTFVGVLLVAAVITWAIVTFISAPYGRHGGDEGWGPVVPNRLAWVVMESPSVWLFAGVWWVASPDPGLADWVLLALWQSHYLWRTFVFPARMRQRPGATMPVLIMSLALVFNALNSLANAPVAAGIGGGATSSAWLTDPRFVVGTLMFVVGMGINRWADEVLRNLRAPGETGYRIPRGGLYRWVSCPNYLGEIVQWTGWAVATWSVAGLAFALYTVANLAPRARDHHRWYHDTFDDYPSARRALIPNVW